MASELNRRLQSSQTKSRALRRASMLAGEPIEDFSVPQRESKDVPGSLGWFLRPTEVKEPINVNGKERGLS